MAELINPAFLGSKVGNQHKAASQACYLYDLQLDCLRAAENHNLREKYNFSRKKGDSDE